jgi:hypothetical protein
VFGLELEQREPGVEEDVELLDSHLKEARKQEVTSLVDNHQQREAHDQLQRANQNYIHRKYWFSV